MRAVIQRVSRAEVRVAEKVVAEIGRGLAVLVGIGRDDTQEDILWLGNKIVNLRIFEDRAGKFNYSLQEINGEILVISQFTLYGDCRKGRRPSFDSAMPPENARRIFNQFCSYLEGQNVVVKKGVFGARMDVELVNSGPVTIILDSKTE